MRRLAACARCSVPVLAPVRFLVSFDLAAADGARDVWQSAGSLCEPCARAAAAAVFRVLDVTPGGAPCVAR